MIESTTRSVLRSGDSRGVALSPKWLQRHKPTRLHVVHVNGFVLVFPIEQTEQLENALGETIARIVRETIANNQPSIDQESGPIDPAEETD